MSKKFSCLLQLPKLICIKAWYCILIRLQRTMIWLLLWFCFRRYDHFWLCIFTLLALIQKGWVPLFEHKCSERRTEWWWQWFTCRKQLDKKYISQHTLHRCTLESKSQLNWQRKAKKYCCSCRWITKMLQRTKKFFALSKQRQLSTLVCRWLCNYASSWLFRQYVNSPKRVSFHFWNDDDWLFCTQCGTHSFSST